MMDAIVPDGAGSISSKLEAYSWNVLGKSKKSFQDALRKLTEQAVLALVDMSWHDWNQCAYITSLCGPSLEWSELRRAGKSKRRTSSPTVNCGFTSLRRRLS